MDPIRGVSSNGPLTTGWIEPDNLKQSRQTSYAKPDRLQQQPSHGGSAEDDRDADENAAPPESARVGLVRLDQVPQVAGVPPAGHRTAKELGAGLAGPRPPHAERRLDAGLLLCHVDLPSGHTHRSI